MAAVDSSITKNNTSNYYTFHYYYSHRKYRHNESCRRFDNPHSDSCSCRVSCVFAVIHLTESVTKQLLSISEDNAATIVKYTEVMRTEVNSSNHYRRDLIVLLCRFSKYHSGDKPFKEISHENIIDFLDSLRKTETKDPMHRWIGTYNIS